MYYISQDYLMHHGVKGMKWGVRHDPEPTGRRRSAGSSTSFYRTTRNNARNAYISKHAQRYQQNQGLSQREARAKAQKRLEIAKKIAIGSAVAVGIAGGVYAARTIGRTRGDEIIKKGETIQTVKQNVNRVLNGDKFFTSYRDADKTKYVGYMGKTKTGLKNKIEATVDKDIRVAGEKNAAKLFKQLKNEDADFRHKFKIWSYKDFNRYELNGETSELGKKFIEKLQSEGYHGVADLNDRRHNFYHTKAVIMFNNKNLTDIKVSALTKSEYRSKRVKAGLIGAGDILSTPASVAIAAGVAGSAALRRYDKKGAQNVRKKQTKNQRSAR